MKQYFHTYFAQQAALRSLRSIAKYPVKSRVQLPNIQAVAVYGFKDMKSHMSIDFLHD